MDKELEVKVRKIISECREEVTKKELNGKCIDSQNKRMAGIRFNDDNEIIGIINCLGYKDLTKIRNYVYDSLVIRAEWDYETFYEVPDEEDEE